MSANLPQESLVSYLVKSLLEVCTACQITLIHKPVNLLKELQKVGETGLAFQKPYWFFLYSMMCLIILSLIIVSTHLPGTDDLFPRYLVDPLKMVGCFLHSSSLLWKLLLATNW